MRPLMVSGGKFIAIGSGSGTIKQNHPPGQGTYGLTKVSSDNHTQRTTRADYTVGYQLPSEHTFLRNGSFLCELIPDAEDPLRGA